MGTIRRWLGGPDDEGRDEGRDNGADASRADRGHMPTGHEKPGRERPPRAQQVQRAPVAPLPDVPQTESPVQRLRAAGVDVPPLTALGRTGDGTVLWGFAAGSDELERWWRRLRTVHAQTGVWPVLLGPADELGETHDLHGERDGRAELARSADLEAEHLLTRLADETGSPSGNKPPMGPDEPDDERSADEQPGEADDEPFVRGAQEPGLVGLVEATAGWQVPALLSWDGAANYDLGGAEHAAVLRRWAQRWGAELVTLSFDTMELLVARPPADDAEAALVAMEQYAYCPDIVDQGVGSLAALAVRQVRAPSWLFWWD